MSIHLNWPASWDPVFVEGLRSQLQSRMRAAMSGTGTSALPLRGNVTVQQLQLGRSPPQISLRKVMEATPKRIVLEVNLQYVGDAFLAVTGLEVNFDLTAAYLAEAKPEYQQHQQQQQQQQHTSAQGVRARRAGDANHALPCWIAFDGRILDLVLDGTFIVELVHGFEHPTEVIQRPAFTSPPAASGVRVGVRLPMRLREAVVEANTLRRGYEVGGPDGTPSDPTSSSRDTPTAVGGAFPLSAVGGGGLAYHHHHHHGHSGVRTHKGGAGLLSSPLRLATTGLPAYGFVPGTGLAAAIGGCNTLLPPRPAVQQRHHDHGATAHDGLTSVDAEGTSTCNAAAYASMELRDVLPESLIGMVMAAKGNRLGAAAPRATARALRVRSVGDPIKSFHVESNFNAMVGDQLTSLLRAVLTPVMQRLMTSGFDIDLPV